MILYQDGKGTYFEWPGLTHYRVYPQILYHDFDADEKKELAVILLVSHGTGWYKMDLHMLEIDDKDENDWGKPMYTEYVLLGDEIEDWFGDSITATLAKDKESITLKICGDQYEVDTDSDITYTGITYGDVMQFSFEDNQIKVQVAIGVLYEEYAIPWYFGDIYANVNFDGENFIIEDYTFKCD